MNTKNIISRISFICESATRLRADKDWWKIYSNAFPYSERETHHSVLKRIKKTKGAALAAKIGKRTIGIGNLHFLESVPVNFLTFLAVAEEQRGKHIGTFLFNFAWEIGILKFLLSNKNENNFWGMIWEVEDPKMAKTAKSRRKKLDRISFYKNLGARLLGNNHYIMPPLHKKSRSQRMLLMFKPFKKKRISKNEIKKIISAIYYENYYLNDGLSLKKLGKYKKDIH